MTLLINKLIISGNFVLITAIKAAKICEKFGAAI
jgi:hypothetical protein